MLLHSSSGCRHRSSFFRGGRCLRGANPELLNPHMKSLPAHHSSRSQRRIFGLHVRTCWVNVTVLRHVPPSGWIAGEDEESGTRSTWKENIFISYSSVRLYLLWTREWSYRNIEENKLLDQNQCVRPSASIDQQHLRNIQTGDKLKERKPEHSSTSLDAGAFIQGTEQFDEDEDDEESHAVSFQVTGSQPNQTHTLICYQSTIEDVLY